MTAAVVLEVLVVVAYVLVLLWALAEIVSADKSATYKLAWLAVVLLFPVWGLVVYYATADRGAA